MADSIQKRENRLGKHVLCWVMTLTFLTLTNASQHCGFTFPSLTPDLKLTEAENSEVDVPFKLDMSQCQGDVSQEVNIVIYKPQKDQQREQGVCSIILEKEECVSTTNKTCHCKDNDNFVFSWKMTTADSGVWHWRVAEIDVSAEVRFSIQDSKPTSNRVTTAIKTTKMRTRSSRQTKTTNRTPLTLKDSTHVTSSINNKDTVVEKKKARSTGDPLPTPLQNGLVVAFLNLVTIISIVVSVIVYRNRPKQAGTRNPRTVLPVQENDPEAAALDRQDDHTATNNRQSPERIAIQL